jgi:PAS domain S-box-containing protein
MFAAFPREFGRMAAWGADFRQMSGSRSTTAQPQDLPGAETRMLELLRRERHVLARIAAGTPLRQVLEELVLAVEEQSDVPLLASVHLLDDTGKRLVDGVAPSLPPAYLRALEGLEIGPQVGSCGTAAFTGEPVYVSDIANDPLWRDYRDLALPHGLRACWSIPIMTADQRVLGTFAAYYSTPRVPAPGELETIALLTQTAALAIQRERSEKALREREAELARVQQIGRVGGVEVDLREGFRNRRSPEYLLIHGLPPEAVNETHEEWVARIHPEDRERTEREFKDAVHAGVTDYYSEYRIIRPSDKQVRWIAVKAFIERDEAGKPLRLVGAHIDVTELRRAERALLESEQRFRLIANSAPVPMWVSELDGSRAFANKAYCDFLGVSYEEALKFDWRQRLHPDDLPRILKEQIAGESSRKPFTLEARYRRSDGDWRWIRSQSQPRWGVNGEQIGFIGVAYDITEAKLAEAELRRHNETLANQVARRTRERDRIWNVSQDLLLVADHSGAWLSVNPAWHSTLGWNEGELLSGSLPALEHPEDRPAHGRAGAQFSLAGRPPRFESRFQHKDGSWRWISWTVASADGLLYGVGRDVTAEKQAETSLRATEEQLRQAQKMEAVGQLTGGIAHDFNNMLTGIIGGLDIISRRIAAARYDDVGRFIEPVVASAHRAAGLTHRLLAFSRRQSLDPKPIDINALVNGMEELLRRSLGEQIALRLKFEERLWTAEADANQLESALLNLVINARDAMAEGGTLTIETENLGIDSGFAALHDGVETGEYVVITVRDTGVGMEQSVIDRAFDPFFTTKPIGQGTGLGLSMVYGFAKQSRGHVTIASEMGSGTTVKVYLPRHRGVAATQSETATSQIGRARDGDTVLVVEDEAAVRLLVVEVLDDLGYRVLQAKDGQAALGIVESEARIDLLLTDVGLPVMNGRQLAEFARARRPGLKVLFMTGYAEQAAVRSKFVGEGMDMIAKPFAMEALTARVQEMLESGKPGAIF